MKTFLKRAGLTLLILLVITSASAFIFRKKIIAALLPEVQQIGEIKIVIKNDTSYISSRMLVHNKTFMKIDIDTLKYKVSLLDRIYMQSVKSLEVELRGYGSDTIDFSIKVPYAIVLKDLAYQKKKGDSTTYSVNIVLQYSTFFGKSEIPFSKSAKLKIPQPPDLEIVDIKYTKVRRKKILANAKIKITNYSNVELAISELDYDMRVLNQGSLKGKFKVPLTIKPNESTYILLPIVINVKNLGKTLFQVMVNKDNYDYTLKMNATFESKDPIDKTFHIELVKQGKMELKK